MYNILVNLDQTYMSSQAKLDSGLKQRCSAELTKCPLSLQVLSEDQSLLH